jgi:PIN domain nuclease of toxin-antitoxin system
VLRLLLDTHTFLWADGRPNQLSDVARAAIADPANEVFVSAAVAWEIAIKYPSGKLTIPMSPASYVPSRIIALGFETLPITQDHALVTASLPDIHADPFDRIMIAQAQFESLTFVTRDAFSLQYPVQTIKA